MNYRMLSSEEGQPDMIDILAKQSRDHLAIDLQEVVPLRLTDLLIRICRQTLEKNRSFIDDNDEIRSMTLTIKLSDTQVPYKVFLSPLSESNPHRH